VKVHLYVEGGPKGTHADGLRRFKNSFKQHLVQLDPRLSNLDVSPCGSTDETIRDYARAVQDKKTDSVVALLVDSDATVTAKTTAAHLRAKLAFVKLAEKDREHIFLMVQCMEAWLVTDKDALEKCFGAKVHSLKFPANPDIESVPKNDILSALDKAASHTPTKHYGKIRDAAEILTVLRPERVAKRSRHAAMLHEFLRKSACA
jgi:hypothetical protein